LGLRGPLRLVARVQELKFVGRKRRLANPSLYRVCLSRKMGRGDLSGLFGSGLSLRDEPAGRIVPARRILPNRTSYAAYVAVLRRSGCPAVGNIASGTPLLANLRLDRTQLDPIPPPRHRSDHPSPTPPTLLRNMTRRLTSGSLFGAHTGSLVGLLLGLSSSGLLDQVLTVSLGVSGLASETRTLSVSIINS